MIASAHYGIDYEVITSSTLIQTIEPVKTFAGPPPAAYQQQAVGFAGQFNGINSMVYSWGGALLFVAFLAEMRHPWDFWKGMLCAQVFIATVYVFFGAFVSCPSVHVTLGKTLANHLFSSGLQPIWSILRIQHRKRHSTPQIATSQ